MLPTPAPWVHLSKEERNIVNRRKISAAVLFFGGTAETFVRHLTKGTAERRNFFYTEGGGPAIIFPSPLQLLPGGMGRAAMHASPRRGRAAVNALLPPACHQAALPSGSRVTLDNIDVAHAHVLLTS